MVLFSWSAINKGGDFLDSCYMGFDPNLWIVGLDPPFTAPYYGHRIYASSPRAHLWYFKPLEDPRWSYAWRLPPGPPTVGYSILRTPTAQDEKELGISKFLRQDTIYEFLDIDGQWKSIYRFGTDSIFYHNVLNPPPRSPSTNWQDTIQNDMFALSGPFFLEPGDTARYSVGILFSDSLDELIVMDEHLQRMVREGLARPSPPPAPRVTTRALDRAVRVTWDDRAESATDPVVPDSLGRAFYGYRVLRAPAEDGPFVEIGRWVMDSLLVHEYVDRGADLSGLKNNVRYYYRVLAFDEGSEVLGFEPMESEVIEGTNGVSEVPALERTNALAQGGSTELAGGTLGDVRLDPLLPRDATTFNALLTGRTIGASLSAETDSVRYKLKAVFRDSLTGSTHEATIDPGLWIHGSAEREGERDSSALVENLFGWNAADAVVRYRLEQQADSFRVLPGEIGSASGADVPVIVQDSLKVTGIKTYTPYTSAARDLEMEFLPGGIDTINVSLGRIFRYLTVWVRDLASGQELIGGTDYTFRGTGLLPQGGVSLQMKPQRYYFTDSLANGTYWEFGHQLATYGSVVAFDYPDRGRGNGKPGLTFPWASGHRRGAVDFQEGDRVVLRWRGGIRGEFPRDAVVEMTGGEPLLQEVTEGMLEKVRIVPNPYYGPS